LEPEIVREDRMCMAGAAGDSHRRRQVFLAEIVRDDAADAATMQGPLRGLEGE
jgi:hypothetical protein